MKKPSMSYISRVAVAAAFALPVSTLAQTPKSPTPKAVDPSFRVTTVAKGLEHPWGISVLPDGRMLVTERPGRLRLVGKDGKLSEPLANVPKVLAQGQGGLLDVALSPNFASDRLVYLAYSEPGDGGAGTAVARGRFTDNALENVQVIWRQVPKVRGSNHWGSRLVFAQDGTLFITTGDRFSYRPKVQDLSTTIGKVVRINADGSIPKDNPFVGKEGARPEIWSYGHRNIQSAALQPQSDQLWTVEHGAMGGDELNQLQAGKNYGWPVISYGVDYSGEKLGEGTAKPGMEQPIYYWDPVIAPSGALFYTGDKFADWKGDLLVGSLKNTDLVRLDLESGRVAKEERYELGQRIRDVVQGPDGFIYLVTDSPEGQILKLEPGR
ncbi:MAG: PQQ-dependent sugar dehydrogenase [Burkholderiales bacterium]